MTDDHIKVLKFLANQEDGYGLSVKQLSNECLLTHRHVRDLVADLVAEGLVESDGPGVAAVTTITWSGRHAVKGALRGKGPMNITGSFVQVGNGNVQTIAEHDDDDDDDDDEYDEDEGYDEDDE